jgi:hypothetical protein
MKKFVSILVLFAFITSCALNTGLQKNRPGSNLNWKNNLSSENIDENIAYENIAYEKETKVNLETKKINSKSKVVSSINSNDIAHNTPDKNDLSSIINSDSKKSFAVDDKFNNKMLNSKQQLKSKKGIKYNDNKKKNKGAAGDNDVIIGVLLCIIGLSPFGVAFVKGRRSEFKINLMIWIGGWAAIIIGFTVMIIGAASLSTGGLGIGAILYYLGGLALLAAFVHGLISVLR